MTQNSRTPATSACEPTWTYRGETVALPRFALLATLDIALLRAGCAILGATEQPRAIFELSSGRDGLIIAELIPLVGGFGVRFRVEADEMDLVEMDEIHERICSLLPAAAAEVHDEYKKEVA